MIGGKSSYYRLYRSKINSIIFLVPRVGPIKTWYVETFLSSAVLLFWFLIQNWKLKRYKKVILKLYPDGTVKEVLSTDSGVRV